MGTMKPTVALRFVEREIAHNDGTNIFLRTVRILQQCWEIVDVDKGVTAIRHEWRDVPLEVE